MAFFKADRHSTLSLKKSSVLFSKSSPESGEIRGLTASLMGWLVQGGWTGLAANGSDCCVSSEVGVGGCDLVRLSFEIAGHILFPQYQAQNPTRQIKVKNIVPVPTESPTSSGVVNSDNRSRIWPTGVILDGC